MLETAWQDVRYGARMLLKNPGFSLVAVLSIAIGVGANTAMFSIADGLIFRPLAVPDASDLVVVWGIRPTEEAGGDDDLSYPDYMDLRERARGFEGLVASRGVIASVARQRGFTGIDIYLPPAFYVPIAMLPVLEGGAQADVLERRDVRTFRVVGRLTPGVSLAQANEEVQLIVRGLERAYRRFSICPGSSTRRREAPCS